MPAKSYSLDMSEFDSKSCFKHFVLQPEEPLVQTDGNIRRVKCQKISKEPNEMDSVIVASYSAL